MHTAFSLGLQEALAIRLLWWDGTADCARELHYGVRKLRRYTGMSYQECLDGVKRRRDEMREEF